MSWKSLVTAGLFCVLASPVLAQPKLEIRSAGLDPTTGQFIWNVRIAPNAATDALATELGFKQTVGNGVAKVSNADSVAWDYNNPANIIFGWEKLNGTPSKPEGLQGNFTGAVAGTTVVNGATLPAGALAQTACLNTTANCAGTGAGTNEIFSAQGSKILAAGDLTTGPALPTLMGTAQTGLANSTAYLQIRTKGPSAAASLTSTIKLLGSHDGANLSGRIADIVGTTSSNYKGFTGSATITVLGGDINLDGIDNFQDVGILATNINLSGKNWAQGDLNGDGTVNFQDVGILATNINVSGGAYAPLVITGATVDTGPGAGLGAGGAVPEPASIALLGLALVGGMGMIRRKR